MALRHAVVRLVVAVAGVRGDVVAADDARTLERRVEDRGVAGHREALERGARDAGDRVEHVRLAAAVEHVVEERAELRARERRALLGDALDDVLELALGHQRGRDPVQAAGGAVLRPQAPLRHGRLVLVAQAGDGAPDPGRDELERGPLVVAGRRRREREVEHADGAEPVLDLELDPLGRRRPRRVAGVRAEALARVERQRGGARPEVLAQARQQVIEHLARGQRVDRGVEQRPQPREQVLSVTALGAGPGSPLHGAESYPPCRQSADHGPGLRRHRRCGRVARDAPAPADHRRRCSPLPATAAAAPPPNDNYLASTTIALRGVPRQRRHDRGDDAARPLQPRPDGLPLGGGDPEPTTCGDGGSFGKTVWWDFKPPSPGGVQIRANGGFDVVVAVYTWSETARASPARSVARTMKRARRTC